MIANIPGKPLTCSKQFPFSFQSETFLNGDSYSLYQYHDCQGVDMVTFIDCLIEQEGKAKERRK